MENNYTHIEVILDRSGSMDSCIDSTIEGFNKFLREQKTIDGKATMTIVQFDDKYEIHQHYVNVVDVSYLNRQNYVPRGGTALLDTICRSIDRLGEELAAKPEHLRPSKVIVLIQTDGQENASIVSTRIHVFDKIKHQREKYNWEFIFAGTNQDAISVADGYGIPSRSSIYYSNTGYGTMNAWSVVSSNISSSRIYGTSTSFTVDDRISTVDSNDTSAWSHTSIPAATVTTITDK